MTLVKTCEPHEPTAPAVHEELTAVERGVLCGALRSRVSVGRKALRIIDRLAAELKASRDFWVDSKQREIEARIAAESRAEALQARVAELEAQQAGFQLRFDGPPGPESPRFIESETLDGKGVSLGDWEQDGDYWLLRVRVFRSNDAESELADLRGRVARALAALGRFPADGYVYPIRAAQEALRGR